MSSGEDTVKKSVCQHIDEYICVLMYILIFIFIITTGLKNYCNSQNRPVPDWHTQYKHWTCTVQYYWHELYTTKDHCTYTLTRTEPHCTALYRIEQHRRGALIYTVQHWTTMYGHRSSCYMIFFFLMYEMSGIMLPIYKIKIKNEF